MLKLKAGSVRRSAIDGIPDSTSWFVAAPCHLVPMIKVTIRSTVTTPKRDALLYKEQRRTTTFHFPVELLPALPPYLPSHPFCFLYFAPLILADDACDTDHRNL
jgi:hypothetical protein